LTLSGHRIASGDRLFTTHQPIWDPRLSWASYFAVWTQPVWWSGTGIVANQFPQRVTMSYVPTINLLSSGVMLADPLMGSTSFMGKTGLFKPVSQLAGWLAGRRQRASAAERPGDGRGFGHGWGPGHGRRLGHGRGQDSC